MDIWKELKQEGVDSGLLEEVRAFRDAHPAPPEAAGRVPRPRFLYYGKEVWEGAAAALLCGEHLLLAVLHATLDFRRVIDVPGYQRIPLDPAARFIGTMNYGYAGTRELNEALVSRFVVLDMPVISQENLQKLLRQGFPELKTTWVEQFSALFQDLRQKCDSGEISTKALDLRGLLSALHLMEKGISSGQALELGIINKAFDPFERQLVADAVWSRIPRDADRGRLFGV